MLIKRSRLYAAVLLSAALGSGCGGPAVSGSLDEATVSGVVKLQGKPVADGVVTFNVANVNRPSAPPREAPIGKDGSYTVTTLVGENNVQVTCKQLRTPKFARYADVEHLFKVEPGSNTFDVELAPKPAAAP